MRFKCTKYTTYLYLLFAFSSIIALAQHTERNTTTTSSIKSGAEVLIENFDQYASLFKDKKVGIVTNQTGMIKDKHIIDALLEKKVKIVKIFSPEHGFRGEADAGQTVLNGRDKKTRLPIVSLYGRNKKPQVAEIANLDIILFDIQDVGVRFYTYISTLTYIMEAAAENNKKVIVLDRPNPNGHYVDGPVMRKEFTSYVGMHPVPVVYGMTIGEYAKMVNGERWLEGGVMCDLTVIKLENYTHNKPVSLPIKPSPNLPNDTAINLYPSTCFFEGTNVSEGRGTDNPFQVYGSPYLTNMDFYFMPTPNLGDKNPKHKGQMCAGEDLRETPRQNEVRVAWLLNAYHYNTKEPFFKKEADGSFWIDKLYGSDELRFFVENKFTEKQIKETWKSDLAKFKKIRAKYLLYP